MTNGFYFAQLSWNNRSGKFAVIPNSIPLKSGYPPKLKSPRRILKKAAAVLEEALRNKTYLCEGRFSVADIVVTYTLIWANAYHFLNSFPVLEHYMNEHRKRDLCPEELK